MRKFHIESNTTFLQVEMINAKACIFEVDGQKNNSRNEVIDAGKWNICQSAISPLPAYLPVEGLGCKMDDTSPEVLNKWRIAPMLNIPTLANTHIPLPSQLSPRHLHSHVLRQSVSCSRIRRSMIPYFHAMYLEPIITIERKSCRITFVNTSECLTYYPNRQRQ